LVVLFSCALAAIALLYYVRTSSQGEQVDSPNSQSPRKELDMRLVQGKISPKRYGKILKLLDAE
jgi:hypothetical protein